MAKQMTRNDMTFELKLDAQQAVIEVDESQLEQIILNLVSNSSYAINKRTDLKTEDKKLTIQTRDATEKDLAKDQVFNGKKNYVIIEVIDNGTGIKPEITNRIFDPFFTTKGRGVGSGLGLSTVVSTIKRYGGHIMFESVPNQQTTFRIFWPVSEKALNLVSTLLYNK